MPAGWVGGNSVHIRQGLATRSDNSKWHWDSLFVLALEIHLSYSILNHIMAMPTYASCLNLVWLDLNQKQIHTLSVSSINNRCLSVPSWLTLSLPHSRSFCVFSVISFGSQMFSSPPSFDVLGVKKERIPWLLLFVAVFGEVTCCRLRGHTQEDTKRIKRMLERKTLSQNEVMYHVPKASKENSTW